ncbi:MAG: phage portal protein [Gammaproteobacteria bacterium]|nr:phage portal protein [Gammaproteobacteria bacterium]
MFLDRIANPQAAITESSELAKMIYGSQSNAGVTVTTDSAMRQSAVYACVSVISETVAQLPLILYMRDGDRKQRAIANRLYSLLHDAPNDFQTSFEWRQTKTAHLCLRGKAFSFINRSVTGEALELLPMHPDRVKIKQHKDYRLEYEFTDADNIRHILRQDQVFRLTGLSFDGVNGISPIAYHRETVGTGIAADKHTALSFKNGAKMNGVLSNPGHFSTTEVAKRVKESWDEAHSGDNAFKTPLLEDGLSWIQTSMNNRDAQYIETRKFQTEEIARIFRVPPHKIGHLEKSTNNNIEHQGLEFVTDTMMPWLRRWEQAIARDLLGRSDSRKYFSEFLVDGLLRGDSKSRAEYYARAVGSNNGPAWLTVNEIRAMENKNSIEGGDVLYVPSSVMPAGENK